jgi:RNA polymerase sigma-70 factor (ECF subfamily)
MADLSDVTVFEAPPDEIDLVERLRSGDDAAYEFIVREYGGRLFTVARRLMGNDADAQDALQDGLLSAFRSIDRFKGDSKLSTWLHRVVVNAALMRLRSQKRRRERTIDDLLPVFNERGHHAARPRPSSPPRDD